MYTRGKEGVGEGKSPFRKGGRGRGGRILSTQKKDYGVRKEKKEGRKLPSP